MPDGKLVHQTSDEFGTVEVVDYMDQFRALHFGNKTQQSISLLCNPYFLIHKYAQAMILPLCWLQAKRVLVLGLGAGSIVKYLYNYHPELIIDAVEMRPTVTDIAIEYFLLPRPDERFTIYNDTAENWLNTNSNDNYDLIIVDVFLTTKSGTNITVDLSTSISQINNKLSKTGVATFNQLGNIVNTYPGFKNLIDVFNSNIGCIDIESTSSIILCSPTKLPEMLEDKTLEKLADISTIPYQIYFKLMQNVTSSD